MHQPRNLAARAGRWSAHHRRKAIFGWLAFVIAAVMVGGAVGTENLDYDRAGVGDSGAADRIVADGFPQRASETVLVESEQAQAGEQRFRDAVDGTIAALRPLPGVTQIESPYGEDGAISADGRSALISFEINGDDSLAEERVDATLAAVDDSEQANPGFRIEEFGDASADKALTKSFEDDFKKAEVTSLPITLLILLFAFGALVAAGVPLILAITAVAATIGLIGPISQLAAVDESIASVILLVGLAVGVDYSMFYLRREREERAAGRSEEAALEAAAATSGRAVLVSGFTVMIAMAGMYLAGASTFTSFATGTIVVVAMAMIGSLTVLPAVLAWLGDRVDKGRIPIIGKRKHAAQESRVWSAILDRVLRHPGISIALSAGLLLVLAIPALGMKTQVSGIDTLPRDLEVIRTYDRIQAAFPGQQIPADVVVKTADVRDPEVQSALDQVRREALASDVMSGPITSDINPAGTVEVLSIPVAGDGTDERSSAALDELRGTIVPDAFAGVAGTEALVTGITAGTEDFNTVMNSNIPYVFAFVLSAAFLLLLVTFRSIVIPLKAILLNLLSVAAAYGVLVLIFQDGHLESLLGFESTGSITAWLPLFLFVILFGLSMDYHVFILTRVREAFDGGKTTEAAVAHGIKSTAGVVTSAALVMISVFGIFATLSAIEFKQMGVGLATAILLDATIVRGVLLPSTMKVLGDWNWYLPTWLEWLPRIGGPEPPPGAGRPPSAGDEPPTGEEPRPEPAAV